MAQLPDKVTHTRDGFCEDGETRISIVLEKLETDYAQKWSKMSPEQYQYRDGTTVDVEVVYVGSVILRGCWKRGKLL